MSLLIDNCNGQDAQQCISAFRGVQNPIASLALLAHIATRYPGIILDHLDRHRDKSP